MNVGDRVRIERDETKYPSKGTWPRFRGKTGTIVEINLGEYGVIFTKVWPFAGRPGKFSYNGPITWFQPYELVHFRAPVAPLSGVYSPSATDAPRKAAAHV